MFDYLIIGQGLAGTMVADQLLRRGRRVMVVDDGHLESSSMVAAGNVNPVSGRRFTLSHRYQESAPAAIEAYERLSRELGFPFIERRPVVRVFRGIEEVRTWEARAEDPCFARLVWERVDRLPQGDAVRAPHGALVIRDAFQVRLPELLRRFRERLEVGGQLMEQPFRDSDLVVSADRVGWGGVEAGRAIFCEGARIRENPLWSSVRLRPAKGEMVRVRIPGLESGWVLQCGIHVIPIGEDRFWVGATVDWEDLQPAPSTAGRATLTRQLERLITLPHEVFDHDAAVRPSTVNRTPILGFHPDTDRLAVLNGLGAKGALWAPACAAQLARCLEEGDLLHGERAYSGVW
jgi:glycine/D-amino acid oxidase-like deaminating enzyme